MHVYRQYYPISFLPYQREGPFTLKPSKVPAPMRLGTPEKKILIASCYYVLLGVIALIALIRGAQNGEATTREIGKYYICESGGIDPDDSEECDRSGFQQYKTTELTVCAYILLGMFPAVNLIFVVNIKEYKQSFIRFIQMLHVRKNPPLRV